MSRYVRCPSCPVDAETTEQSYEVVGKRGGSDLYQCGVCGTRFQALVEEREEGVFETVKPITLSGPPAKAHDSVIRVSEAPATRSERRARAKNVQNPKPLAGPPREGTNSEPEPINLHSDVGWVYPATPDRYHFDWEPPDLGQEPPSKWRRNWNEAVNMFKYFRLVNDPLPPRPAQEKGPSYVYRGLEELLELKSTEPDAI